MGHRLDVSRPHPRGHKHTDVQEHDEEQRDQKPLQTLELLLLLRRVLISITTVRHVTTLATAHLSSRLCRRITSWSCPGLVAGLDVRASPGDTHDPCEALKHADNRE